MYLVDDNRGLERVPGRPLPHPAGVVPGIASQVPNLRRSLGRKFGGEAVRIRLVDLVIVDAGDDRVLVGGTWFETGDESLPDPGGSNEPHRVRGGIPVVEFADDRD